MARPSPARATADPAPRSRRGWRPDGRRPLLRARRGGVEALPRARRARRWPGPSPPAFRWRWSRRGGPAAVSRRFEELGLAEVHQGVADKLVVYEALRARHRLRPRRGRRRWATISPTCPSCNGSGSPIAPADAVPAVRRVARLGEPGGRGPRRRPRGPRGDPPSPGTLGGLSPDLPRSRATQVRVAWSSWPRAFYRLLPARFMLAWNRIKGQQHRADAAAIHRLPGLLRGPPGSVGRDDRVESPKPSGSGLAATDPGSRRLSHQGDPHQRGRAKGACAGSSTPTRPRSSTRTDKT